MKKKIILLGIIIFIVCLFSGYYFFNKNFTDALKFKREYESLNGKLDSNGNKYHYVSISKENPFVYATAEDIIRMINEKETFALYFGYESCQWSRSIIEQLIKASDNLNVEKICYVDIEDIRDELKIDDLNNITTVKSGTEEYYTLLKLLDDVLSSYEFTSSDGEKISTEKRIYSPNVVAIVNGKALKLTTGVSDKQLNSCMELTTEMKEESYNKLREVLEYVKPSNTCDVQSAC